MWLSTGVETESFLPANTFSGGLAVADMTDYGLVGGTQKKGILCSGTLTQK